MRLFCRMVFFIKRTCKHTHKSQQPLKGLVVCKNAPKSDFFLITCYNIKVFL